jgi:hypothetical protein
MAINQINSAPINFATVMDDNNQPYQANYSYDPGHVGHLGFVADDPSNPESSGTQQWIPSKYDFTGAKYNKDLGSYIMPNGDVVKIDPNSDSILSYLPSKANNVFRNSFGELVGTTSNDLNFQGSSYSPQEGQGPFSYLVDPKTNEFIKDANGLPKFGTNYNGNGGFTDWVANNGWIAPLAMAGGAALGAAGVIGGAAEAGAGTGAVGAAEGGGAAGYGGADAYMAGSGLNAGTYGAADFAGAGGVPFELPDGTMGSIQNGNILDSSGNIVAKGGTETSALKEALSTANRARSLANLLNGVAGMGNSSSKGVSGTAAYNAQPLDYSALIVKNKNPFLFETPGQTKAMPGEYDVSGSNLANALRKNNGTYP